jgi:hypothetical protein
MQNEAKLGKTGACGQTGHRVWGGFDGKRNVRNEPNLSPCARERARRPGPGRVPRGPIVQNEPNSRRCRVGRGRRGVVRRRNAQNEANCQRAARVAESEACKTNPIWRGQMCETKPNLGRLGYLGDGVWGAYCAKRSQFGPAGPGGRRPGGRDPGPWNAGQMYKTNPISPSLGGAEVPAAERCETNPISESPTGRTNARHSTIVGAGARGNSVAQRGGF